MRSQFYSIALVLTTLLSACASSPDKITSVGRYGDAPAAPERGFSRTQIFDGTFDEVWDSSRQVIARIGLFVEETDKAKGKLTGGGVFQTVCVAGPCGITMVYAVYVKELKGREPRVEVTAMADAPKMYDWQGKGHATNLVNRFVGDVQKNLATLR